MSSTPLISPTLHLTAEATHHDPHVFPLNIARTNESPIYNR
jgi:hypothetical protein